MLTSKYGKYSYGANKYSRAHYTELAGSMAILMETHGSLSVKHIVLLQGSFDISFDYLAKFSLTFHMKGTMSINIDMTKAGELIYLGPFWDPDDPDTGFWVPDVPDEGGWVPITPSNEFWVPDSPSVGPWSRMNKPDRPWKPVNG